MTKQEILDYFSSMGINEAFNNPNMYDSLSCMLDELQEVKQEAVKPVLDEKTGRIWLCGNCGSYVGFEDNDPHDPNEFDKFCRECGTPVLWESR